jgi:hypothetical protein
VGQRETPVEEYLVAQVKAAGGHVRKLAWIGRVGAPDRLVWWRFPHVAMVELKGAKGRYEASQKRELARLRETGWPVYTLWSKGDVDKFIAEMKQRLHSDLI